MYHYAANNPVRYTDPDGRVAFCVVTAVVGAGIGATYGAIKSYNATGSVDWKEVGKGALIGGVAGLGIGLIAAQAATSTALVAGNCLASFSEVTGIGTGAVATVASGTAAVVESPSSAKLAKNLISEGISRPAQTAAHHIVAGSAKAAKQARAVLAKFNISINDAINGVFLPANRNCVNPTGAMVHSTLHTTEYYDRVNELLGNCLSRKEAIDTLKLIGEKLSNGSW